MAKPCDAASTTSLTAAPRIFASDTALVLAHLDCDEKSNEIPAVQTLLGSLALSDAVVTVDAMHCQKKHSSMPLPVASI
jgi:hypothetical protein